MNKLSTFLRESAPARALIPAGVILLIFGAIMFVINNQNQNYIKTTATVSNVEISQEEYTDADGNIVEATYNATVQYTVDNKEYTSTLDNVSKYSIGDKLTIYYNPKDPSQITQTKSLILPIVFVIAGIVSFIAGIVSAVNAVQRNKKMKDQERSWNHGQ